MTPTFDLWCRSRHPTSSTPLPDIPSFFLNALPLPKAVPSVQHLLFTMRGNQWWRRRNWSLSLALSTGGVEIGKHLSKSGPPGIQQASLSHFCACQPYDRRNTGGEWSRQELKRNRRSVSLQVKHAGKLKHSQYEPRKLVDAFQKSCWTWGQVQLMAFWKSSLTKTLALRWF